MEEDTRCDKIIDSANIDELKYLLTSDAKRKIKNELRTKKRFSAWLNKGNYQPWEMEE